MATTLAELVADIRLLSGLRSNQLYTDTQIISIASDLWAELYDRFVTTNQHYRIKEFDFTLTGGVGGNSVDLPSDFQLGNGLELDPTDPRPRSVKYLDNWLNRNNLGASILAVDGGLIASDRAYCFTDATLKVFPADSSAGNYRLYYTPQADKFAATITRTFDLVGANDTPIVPAPGFTPTMPGAWVVTDAAFSEDMPMGGEVSLVLDFDVPNTAFNGAYFIEWISGPTLTNISTYDTAGVSNLASSVGFMNPAVGTGTYTYQPLNTISELPDWANPWAIYLKLGASIAIREARQQDVSDLERRFISQKQRVDSVLQNRQEEATQPPLTGGRSFWDSL